MKAPIHKIIGETINGLMVLGFLEYRKGHYIMDVICKCGNRTKARYASILNGHTKTCGCLKNGVGRRNADKFRTHGLTLSKTYRAWNNMWQRCTNEKKPTYKDYGGRGISVCEEWKSFDRFLEDMGIAPEGLTLERVNNEAGYSAGNCRWATQKEQNENRRNTIRYSVNGETRTLTQWSEKTGLNKRTITARIQSGWSVEKAITTPPSWSRA